MIFRNGLKILCALGLRRCLRFARYLLIVKSGWARLREGWAMKRIRPSLGTGRFFPLVGIEFPELSGKPDLRIADEIAAGFFRPYQTQPPQPLIFPPSAPDRHWSQLGAFPETADIKDAWEPARFGWASELARAWSYTGDARYAAVFRANFERFMAENPPFNGVQSLSAQEVALRMIQVVFASSVFSRGGEPFPDPLLEWFVRCGAERILTTRDYAIVQNNNHWLSEAAGLMTAGVAFPEAPDGQRCFDRGWRDFQAALAAQILPDGEYVQYSANYHRLALQLVLWVNLLLQQRGLSWPEKLIPLLQRTIRRLADQADALSGRADNVGHNDGANLFAFGADFPDYRPTLQACSRVFLGSPIYAAGPWDGLGDILNARPLAASLIALPELSTYFNHTFLRIDAGTDWAALRAVGYRRDRPAHADQLQVSIWHKGKALALDPGTYRYNGAPRFENRLKYAALHNGVVIDDREPMTDAGKFLWLDWKSARILTNESDRLAAEHFAYRRLGVSTKRRLIRTDSGWRVIDELTSGSAKVRMARINWLIADEPIEVIIDNGVIRADSASFSLRMRADGEKIIGIGAAVIHGGKLIREIGAVKPIPREMAARMGWFSPCYATIQPAVSLVFTVVGIGDMTLTSDWIVPPQISGESYPYPGQ